MEEDIYLDKLVRRDIKPTAIRLLVIKEMMRAGIAPDYGGQVNSVLKGKENP